MAVFCVSLQGGEYDIFSWRRWVNFVVKTRAPLRISFAGGGTDIEPYCSEYGGCVLSAAIQIYAYADYPALNPQPSQLESLIGREFNKDGLLKVSPEALPMSGLGGSASCFVAGIKAVQPELDRREIAELAYHLERDVLGVLGGRQDQYASTFGGLNYMEFGARVELETLSIPESLDRSLYLVYLGRRNYDGADIIKDQMARDNLANFAFQKEIVRAMKMALMSKDLLSFGELLEKAWESKVKFSPYITTDDILSFHKKALENGAIGGKLTGAGGGGYMLLMEHPERKGELVRYLTSERIDFLNVKFDMEGVKCLDAPNAK